MISRRGLMSGAGAVLLYGSTPAVASGTWPADAFAGSVGICAHVGTGPYRSPLFPDLIGASGIRNLRWDLDISTDFSLWRELYTQYSIRSQILVSPSKNTIAQVLGYLDTVGAASVAAVEGMNEGDNEVFAAQQAARGGWNEAVVRYQREVFQALRSRYAAEVLPVVAPTLIDYKPHDVALIRDAAPFCDIVALHSYMQHGEEPETHDDYAALSWYIRNFADKFKPGAPIMVTETGYTNVIAAGHAGNSEHAAAIYLPRLLLNNFAAGVLRTFLYEFMDSGLDPKDDEHNYGIVHFDGTPKPAYHAIAALLGAMEERGSTAAVNAPGRPINLAFSNPPTDLRQLTFIRRDATAVVALWRPVRVWDVARAADIAVAPQSLLIAPAWKVGRADYMVLDRKATWSRLQVAAGQIEVPVGAAVTLLRLETKDV